MRDKDFLTSIYDCVFYLLVSFTENLCTCTVYVLKTQELELNENCCHRKNTKKPLNKLIFCFVSTDSVEEDFVSDTDDEDELSVVAVNEDQNVCITLLSKAILNVEGLNLQKTCSDHFECLKRVLLLLCMNGVSI